MLLLRVVYAFKQYMITLALILLFIGSYALYNTSDKAILANRDFEKWCKKNKTISKIGALVIFGITLVISIFHYGLTSGILFWFFSITLMLSLIVTLNPLKLIKPKTVVFLFVITLIFEFLV